MNTAKARRLFAAYAQIHAKLEIMERETDLKKKAHQEARRKLIEALSRLEVAVGGLPRLAKGTNPLELPTATSRGTTGKNS